MKIIQLQAENFKRLKAVEIAPDGNLVTIGGRNGSGKSSVLDAIYVALKGRSVGPPKPVRTGEEKCLIRLDLGELAVTRSFTVKEGGTFTDSLKVENADGLRYGKPQEVLDALLGEIGFDPFAFCQMRPADQAETLLQMVPLPCDLDEMAELDRSDFEKRRDINRDVVSLRAQRDAIPKEDVPDDLPDRATLQDQLGSAAETNGAIERDRVAREATARNIEALSGQAAAKRVRATELRAEADRLEQAAGGEEAEVEKIRADLEGLPALAEPVDVGAIQQRLREADAVLAAAERQRRRAELETAVAAKEKQSQALTDALAARERERQAALAEAQMPIEGLAFGLDEKGKPAVQFGGVPFEQASTAEQLRASVAIAMAANPSLRVLRVKDGALLDEESMRLLAETATENDFQLWVEVVAPDEGVGFIMEEGEVKATPAAKPKAAKADAPAKTEKAAKPAGEKLL